MIDTFSVSNAQELRKALTKAKGGDTIELAAGDYGQLDLLTFKIFGVKAIYDSPVTITSADPEDRASFSGMDLRQVKNLTFDNVVFDSDYAGGNVWVGPFKIKNSENITIRNSLFEGELASGTGDPAVDGFATGKGLRVNGGSDIVIENNEFTTFHRGLVVSGVDDVQITGNDVHSMRSDGMNFMAVQGLLIEDNHIHDFVRSRGSSDHRDMIQFWTNGSSRPSTDIVIRGNTLDVGDGSSTHSIFMRNEEVDNGRAGEEMFYRNVLIEENVILNNHVHGISVGETDGLVIRKNSVLDANAEKTASVATPKINVNSDSKNVVIEQNATAAIWGNGDQPGWTVAENALVQNSDLNMPGHYSTEFIHSSMGGPAEAYLPDPDGMIARLDAGASRLRLDSTPDSLRTEFDVSADPDYARSLVFDAGHTYGPTGGLAGSDALFVWDFGDGTGATGQVVRHSYAEAGRYDATLTVVTPDGAMASATSEVSMMGADMLSFDPQTGFIQAEGYGEATDVMNSDRSSVAHGDGYAIDLGDEGVATGASESHIARLFGAENFDMSMTLRADTLGSTGEVARIQNNLILSIENRGEIGLRLWTDEEYIKLTTSRVTVNDGEDHDIRIAFDGASDRLEIHVDGELAAATDVEGAMRGDDHRSLHFGHAWGGKNFDGTLTAFDLDVRNQDYPDYAGDVTAIPSDAVPVDDLPSTSPGAAAPDEDARNEQEPDGDITYAQGPIMPQMNEATAVLADFEADRLEVTIDEDMAGKKGASALQVEAPDFISLIASSVRSDTILAAQSVYADVELADDGDMEAFVEDVPIL